MVLERKLFATCVGYAYGYIMYIQVMGLVAEGGVPT